MKELVSRISGEEKDAFEMASKLTKYNFQAQLYLRILIKENKDWADEYMLLLDKLGLYDGRINLLFKACNCDYSKFYKAIDKLEEINHSFIEDLIQARILEMQSQEEYDLLVKELLN